MSARSSSKKQDTYKKGHWAEFVAKHYLRFKGYKIIRARYKTGAGEIDLIARKGANLVFFEVKGRASFDEALYAVTPRMQKRIENAARLFCAENSEYQDFYLRFDVVAVRWPFHVRHLDNAWRPHA
jgi:putative endonuclease